MAEFTLQLKIDQDHVRHFNTSGFKLCVAAGVSTGSSDPTFNVVAFSSLCAANVTVTWQEEFQIAATHDGFSAGKKFTVSTTPQNVLFGESYTLPADWTDQSPNADPHAPQDGFLFINKTPGASAIVYKKVNGVPSPIYISGAGPLPPGKETLTPKTSMMVWFEAASDTGIMVSEFDTPQFTIDYIGTTTHTASYSADGTWTVTA